MKSLPHGSSTDLSEADTNIPVEGNDHGGDPPAAEEESLVTPVDRSEVVPEQNAPESARTEEQPVVAHQNAGDAMPTPEEVQDMLAYMDSQTAVIGQLTAALQDAQRQQTETAIAAGNTSRVETGGSSENEGSNTSTATNGRLRRLEAELQQSRSLVASLERELLQRAEVSARSEVLNGNVFSSYKNKEAEMEKMLRASLAQSEDTKIQTHRLTVELAQALSTIQALQKVNASLQEHLADNAQQEKAVAAGQDRIHGLERELETTRTQLAAERKNCEIEIERRHGVERKMEEAVDQAEHVLQLRMKQVSSEMTAMMEVKVSQLESELIDSKLCLEQARESFKMESKQMKSAHQHALKQSSESHQTEVRRLEQRLLQRETEAQEALDAERAARDRLIARERERSEGEAARWDGVFAEREAMYERDMEQRAQQAQQEMQTLQALRDGERESFEDLLRRKEKSLVAFRAEAQGQLENAEKLWAKERSQLETRLRETQQRYEYCDNNLQKVTMEHQSLQASTSHEIGQLKRLVDTLTQDLEAEQQGKREATAALEESKLQLQEAADQCSRMEEALRTAEGAAKTAGAEAEKAKEKESKVKNKFAALSEQATEMQETLANMEEEQEQLREQYRQMELSCFEEKEGRQQNEEICHSLQLEVRELQRQLKEHEQETALVVQRESKAMAVAHQKEVAGLEAVCRALEEIMAAQDKRPINDALLQFIREEVKAAVAGGGGSGADGNLSPNGSMAGPPGDASSQVEVAELRRQLANLTAAQQQQTAKKHHGGAEEDADADARELASMVEQLSMTLMAARAETDLALRSNESMREELTTLSQDNVLLKQQAKDARNAVAQMQMYLEHREAEATRALQKERKFLETRAQRDREQLVFEMSVTTPGEGGMGIQPSPITPHPPSTKQTHPPSTHTSYRSRAPQSPRMPPPSANRRVDVATPAESLQPTSASSASARSTSDNANADSLVSWAVQEEQRLSRVRRRLQKEIEDGKKSVASENVPSSGEGEVLVA